MAGMRVKLVDFEFAYKLGSVIEEDTCGTSGYIAPEWCSASTTKQLKVSCAASRLNDDSASC
jgi:hypothetical protein